MTLRDKLREAVYDCGGLKPSELAVLLERDAGQINQELRKLLAAGEVMRLGKGTSGSPYTYYKSNGNSLPAQPSKKSEPPKPTDEGWHARYDALVLRIKDLEEWKEEAIRRYPDLAVPEIILKARRHCAKANQELGPKFLSGSMDDKPMMLAVISALEECAS